jgi:hypothetical protein
MTKVDQGCHFYTREECIQGGTEVLLHSFLTLLLIEMCGQPPDQAALTPGKELSLTNVNTRTQLQNWSSFENECINKCITWSNKMYFLDAFFFKCTFEFISSDVIAVGRSKKTCRIDCVFTHTYTHTRTHTHAHTHTHTHTWAHHAEDQLPWLANYFS